MGKTVVCLSRLETTTIGVGRRAMISFTAANPSLPGITTSRVTTSGSRDETIATACSALAALPTTRMSGSFSSPRARMFWKRGESSTTRTRIILERLRSGRGRRLQNGKLEGEGTPLADRASRPDLSAVGLDVLLTDEEPEACPLDLSHDLSLPAPIAGEEAVQLVLGNADARVADRDRRERALALHPHSDLARVDRVLDGVRDEVREDLLDAARVDPGEDRDAVRAHRQCVP